MSIQILPENQNATSAIGSGVGRGLAQQIPEEIKRYRLSSGLKDLGEQSQQRSPFENIAALSSIPGIDPGLMGVLAPLLQQQQQRQEALGQGNPGLQGRPMPAGNQSPRFESNADNSSANSDRREYREGYLQQANENQISQRAQQLLRERPYSFPTEESARARAAEELNRDYNADVSYQQRLDVVEKDFDDATKSYLGKEKGLQEGEIGGPVRSFLLNKAKDELSTSNQSPRKIAEKYAKQALEISKEKQSMRNVYADWTKFTPPTEKDIESLRRVEQKYNQYKIPQDVFIDDLMSTQSISRAAASYIADPLTNTNVGKYLKSVPENRGFTGIKSSFSNPEAKIAKEIADKLKPDDLMGSIAYIAQQKGYDGNKLLSEIQRLVPDNKITEQQARDLRSKPIPKIAPLDEVWLLGFSGENKKARK